MTVHLHPLALLPSPWRYQIESVWRATLSLINNYLGDRSGYFKRLLGLWDGRRACRSRSIHLIFGAMKMRNINPWVYGTIHSLAAAMGVPNGPVKRAKYPPFDAKRWPGANPRRE
jgi:hypothetical protein